MAAAYNITQTEMENFLHPQGFIQINLPGVHELVYAKRVDIDGLALALRIYTGINPSGNSRDVGTDAIRCVIFWKNDAGEIRKVATTKRAHRVAGWKKNLQDRLDNIRVGKKCPVDSAPLVARKGRNANGSYSFLGCANYPNCKHTEKEA